MTKRDLNNRVDSIIATTREALQILLDNLNKGQQKQIVKNKEVKALFERYGVEYEE